MANQLALTHSRLPDMQTISDARRLINVDQAAVITRRFLDISRFNESARSRKREFSQFLHNSVIIVKQALLDEGKVTNGSAHVLLFLLGLLVPSEFSQTGLRHFNLTFFNKNTTILTFLTKENDSTAIVLENSTTNIHCFTNTEFRDQKAVLVGRLRIVDDNTYDVLSVPTCKHSLSDSISKYMEKPTEIDRFSELFAKLKVQLSRKANVTKHFSRLVLGSAINTLEPSVWWYNMDRAGTVTLVRRSNVSHFFALRVGEHYANVVLPKKWNVSECTTLNVVYNPETEALSIDLRKLQQFVDKSEHIRYPNFPSLQHTINGNRTAIAFYEIITFAIDSGITETFDQLESFLSGYLSTYGQFKKFYDTEKLSHVFYISLYENSNILLHVSQSSGNCFDIHDVFNRMAIDATGLLNPVKLITVKLASDFVGLLSVKTYETTLIYSLNDRIYLRADNAFKIIDESVGGKAPCISSMTIIDRKMPKHSLDVGEKKIEVTVRAKISSIIQCSSSGADDIGCLLTDNVNVHVDPASYWYLSNVSITRVMQNTTKIASTVLSLKCPRNLQTASLSPKLSPLWIFEADYRIRRVFRSSQKSELTLLSKECDSWTETTSTDLQNHVIIQVSADYYSRHVLIGEPGKQNVKLLGLGRPRKLRHLEYLGKKIPTEPPSDKIFKQSTETPSNDMDLEINIVGKNELTSLVDCLDASNGTNVYISCTGVRTCETSYGIVRPLSSNNTRNCRVNFHILRGGTVLINHAKSESFAYYVSGNESSLQLHLGDNDDTPDTSSNHVIVLNRPFTGFSNSSSFSTDGGYFQLYFYNNDDMRSTYAFINVSIKQMEHVTITVEFLDNIQCLLDSYQTVCTGQATSSEDLTHYRPIYQTMSVTLRSIIVVTDQAKTKTMSFCGPDPKSKNVALLNQAHQTAVTWWQVYKNDPAQTLHFFCTTNTLGTFYDIKMLQPNHINTLLLHKNTVHVYETPEKQAIVLSLRRLCWQMKERDNELELEHHLSENGQLLTVDILNTAPGRHKSFKIGEIVIHEAKTAGLLDKICLELETFMKFQINTVGTIELVPVYTKVDKGTDLVALQPESSVRKLHFVVQAAVSKHHIDFYRIDTNLVVCFKKQDAEEGGWRGPKESVTFALLLMRYFETAAFQEITMAFLNSVVVLKRS